MSGGSLALLWAGGFMVGLGMGTACSSIHFDKRAPAIRESGYLDGKRDGRCVELCRPEKFIERVNDGKECLCTSKRVVLK